MRTQSFYFRAVACSALLMLAACSSPEAPQPDQPVNPAQVAESAKDVTPQRSTSNTLADRVTPDSGVLQVSRAWIRMAPPNSQMLAGYFDLHNGGEEKRRVVGARSDAFGSIGLHRSYLLNGVSHMRPVNSVSVGPGGSLSFEPGGLHLMLMAPNGKLVLHQKVKLWLRLEDGSHIEEVPFEAEVLLDPPAGS